MTQIHLDKRNHAYGVTYSRHGLTRFVLARREIILSAGSVDSPKLLMLSGIGPKEHLRSVGVKR
jgi:choline dehydrogenase-like flavoprotein